jgi:VWFA-related protein
VKSFLIVGAMACTLAGTATFAQSTSTSTPAAIPDAPRPQTALPAVTPGIGAGSSSSDTPDNTTPQSDGFDQAVGSKLPSSPQAAKEPDDHDFVQDPTPESSASALPTLRLQSNLVVVPFTVKDKKGGLVPGIDWREVRVFENGVRQHMAVFTVDPIPLSIAIVIDQSLDYHTMDRINESLGALPAVFTPYDEVAVFTYNNGPQERTTYTAGNSERLSAVLEQSKSTGRDPIYYGGGPLARGIDLNGGAMDNTSPLTAPGPASPTGLTGLQDPREVHTLNDAILMAAQSLAHAAPDRRRIVYVISDGKEYGSKAKTKDVIRYLQTNNIGVYATLTGDSSVAGMGFLDHVHLPLMMRDNLLPVYTNATGGQTFAEFRTKGIETSFQKITEQVRTQYTVGYYSREPLLDSKFRTLEVRVLRPGLNVIAEKGYYPAAKPVAPVVRQTSQTQ